MLVSGFSLRDTIEQAIVYQGRMVQYRHYYLGGSIFRTFLWISRPILAAEFRCKGNSLKDSQYTKHNFLG
jgi:hypothetical protein